MIANFDRGLSHTLIHTRIHIRCCIPHFIPIYKLYLQSWTNVLGHFCISGAFSNSHRPNPSLHPTNKVERLYPEFIVSFNFV